MVPGLAFSLFRVCCPCRNDRCRPNRRAETLLRRDLEPSVRPRPVSRRRNVRRTFVGTRPAQARTPAGTAGSAQPRTPRVVGVGGLQKDGGVPGAPLKPLDSGAPSQLSALTTSQVSLQRARTDGARRAFQDTARGQPNTYAPRCEPGPRATPHTKANPNQEPDFQS